MIDRLPEDKRLQFVPKDQRPLPTSQLAVRVARVSAIALAMFGALFLRLWYLQVLTGHRYVAEAQVNRVRDVAFPAPRGEILERHGNVLVASRAAVSVQLAVPELPKSAAARRRLYRRLAVALGMSSR